MEVNNGNKTVSMEKIEKQNCPNVMNLDMITVFAKKNNS